MTARDRLLSIAQGATGPEMTVMVNAGDLERALAQTEQPEAAGVSREDLQDSINAMMAAVGYTKEYALQWPSEKVSVTFKRWFDEQIAAAATPSAQPSIEHEPGDGSCHEVPPVRR